MSSLRLDEEIEGTETMSSPSLDEKIAAQKNKNAELGAAPESGIRLVAVNCQSPVPNTVTK